MVDNPSELPNPQERTKIEEPYVRLDIMTPQNFIGTLMELCETRRGNYIDMKFITKDRATLTYEVPLAEIVTDFFDQMKSRTKGYASMEYEVIGYRENDLVKVDILVNEEPVDALACIAHREKSYHLGKNLVSKLKELIPRHQFQIPVQAAIGTKILARENIPAMRKNVLSKCYGGDVSRKKKLLEKQKEGKKRMKSIGVVDVPQEAFMAILQLNGDQSKS